MTSMTFMFKGVKKPDKVKQDTSKNASKILQQASKIFVSRVFFL